MGVDGANRGSAPNSSYESEAPISVIVRRAASPSSLPRASSALVHKTCTLSTAGALASGRNRRPLADRGVERETQTRRTGEPIAMGKAVLTAGEILPNRCLMTPA